MRVSACVRGMYYAYKIHSDSDTVVRVHPEKKKRVYYLHLVFFFEKHSTDVDAHKHALTNTHAIVSL